MTHTITVTISAHHEPTAEFTCYEPDDAWCRQNVVGPGEEPPEDPLDCWFTVLASGLVHWGIYDGPPTELRSGEVEFVCVSAGSGGDMCFWHYRGDVGQFPTGRAGSGCTGLSSRPPGPTMNQHPIRDADTDPPHPAPSTDFAALRKASLERVIDHGDVEGLERPDGGGET